MFGIPHKYQNTVIYFQVEQYIMICGFPSGNCTLPIALLKYCWEFFFSAINLYHLPNFRILWRFWSPGTEYKCPKAGWVLECGHLILWSAKLISHCVPHLSYRSQCFWHHQNTQGKRPSAILQPSVESS